MVCVPDEVLLNIWEQYLITNIKEAQGSSSVPQELSSVPSSAFTIMVRSASVEENTPTSVKTKRPN